MTAKRNKIWEDTFTLFPAISLSFPLAFRSQSVYLKFQTESQRQKEVCMSSNRIALRNFQRPCGVFSPVLIFFPVYLDKTAFILCNSELWVFRGQQQHTLPTWGIAFFVHHALSSAPKSQRHRLSRMVTRPSNNPVRCIWWPVVFSHLTGSF